MNQTALALQDESIMLIFAYSKTGFTNIRVMNALYHGIPESVHPLRLESKNNFITSIHKLTNTHTLSLNSYDWIQSRFVDGTVSSTYRNFIHRHSKIIYQQLSALIDQRVNAPSQVLIISTDFILSHQIAALKNKIEQEKRIKILLVVQITDITPQKLWYVSGTDLITVPSHFTQELLHQYAVESHLPSVPIEILPYPVNPNLAKTLTEHQYQQRLHQVRPGRDVTINVSIPISEAAVDPQYFSELIDGLHRESSQFRFHVVIKSSRKMQKLMNKMMERAYIVVHPASTDRNAVEEYENIFKNVLISLEITNPSEQISRALIDPERLGGALLLFTNPVNRQESDNLTFLMHHNLIPNMHIHTFLWKHAEKDLPIGIRVLHQAKHWRGLRVPPGSKQAAHFIAWCKKYGVFSAMMMKKIGSISNKKESLETLGAESVDLFWDRVANLLISAQT